MSDEAILSALMFNIVMIVSKMDAPMKDREAIKDIFCNAVSEICSRMGVSAKAVSADVLQKFAASFVDSEGGLPS